MACNAEQSLLTVVRQQNQRITNLEQSLKDQEFVQPFLQAATCYPLVPSLKAIEHARSNIISAVYCLGASNNVQSAHTDPGDFISATWKTLVERCVGRITSAPPDEANMFSPVADQFAGAVMLSLVGVAIREWVFLAGIRPAALLVTPLLDQYRHHLESLCKSKRANIMNF